MPSPFPGMNPYFEQTDQWLDFHTEFLSAMRWLLAPQVAPKYIVQFDDHIYIHDLPPEQRHRLATADLSLVQRDGGPTGSGRAWNIGRTGGDLAPGARRRKSAFP